MTEVVGEDFAINAAIAGVDSGRYVCTAKNSIGLTEKTIQVHTEHSLVFFPIVKKIQTPGVDSDPSQHGERVSSEKREAPCPSMHSLIASCPHSLEKRGGGDRGRRRRGEVGAEFSHFCFHTFTSTHSLSHFHFYFNFHAFPFTFMLSHCLSRLGTTIQYFGCLYKILGKFIKTTLSRTKLGLYEITFTFTFTLSLSHTYCPILHHFHTLNLAHSCSHFHLHFTLSGWCCTA